MVELGGSIPMSQVQELRKIPSALPSLFPPSRVQNYFLDIAGPTSLRLTWTAPASNGGSSVLGYKIRVINQSTSATVYESATYDTSPFTATGLTAGVSYQVRIAAANVIGQGEQDYSDSIPGAVSPGAPTALSGTAGDGTASLTWSAPASDGGASITGYVVEYTPAGGSAQTSGTGSASTSFQLNSGNSTITNAVAQSIRVAAVNAAGQGPYGSAVSVTPRTVPGAPTALAATSNADSSVPLSWSAPASNGGASITGYVVEWTPAGGSASTVSTGSASTSYTKTGLTNGTAYGFRVAAVNPAGQGPYSGSVSATPQTVGDPYYQKVALLLHFDGINTANGESGLTDSSPFQRFAYFAGGTLTTDAADQSPAGGTACLHLSTTSDYSGNPPFPLGARDLGLNAGTGDFTFEWWGNHIGTADTNQTMPTGAVWSTESDEAGRPVIYIDRLQKTQNGQWAVVLTCWRRQTDYPYHENYRWAVDITAQVGQWTHYAVSRTGGVTRVFINGALATLGTTSMSPDSPARAFDTTATSVADPCVWNFPSGASQYHNIGMSLFGYRWAKVGGFADEVRYTVGVGRYSASFSAPTVAFPDTGPNLAPDAPTNLVGTGGNAQIALTWTAPARTGGAAITDYVVQYSSNAGSSWTTFADGTSTAASATITGLTNLTGYLVRVAAVNSVGTGDYVTSGTVTPSEPINITQQPLNTYTGTNSATGTLSVTATGGGGSLTYQWQWYGPDYPNSDYTNQWRNLPDKTSSSVVLSSDYITGTIGYWDFDYSPSVQIRCAVAVSGGSPTYTQAVRFLCLQNAHQPYPNWYNGSNGGGANYGQPQTMSPGSTESVKVDINDYSYGGIDMSWFSGNDVTVKVQVATSGYTDAANWSDLSSTGYRGSFYVGGYEIFPSTGTKYYRAIAVVKWPFTATNGTSSFTPGSLHIYSHSNYDALQVTWP